MITGGFWLPKFMMPGYLRMLADLNIISILFYGMVDVAVYGRGLTAYTVPLAVSAASSLALFALASISYQVPPKDIREGRRGGASMGIEPTLLAERELGELARKIIIYRYKVYSASMIAIPHPCWHVVGSPRLAAAYVMVLAFRKGLRSLEILARHFGNTIDWRRINIVFMLSYSVPFVVAYAVQPLPSWHSYSWYIALLVANASVTLFYERYMNRAVPGVDVRVYLT